MLFCQTTCTSTICRSILIAYLPVERTRVLYIGLVYAFMYILVIIHLRITYTRTRAFYFTFDFFRHFDRSSKRSPRYRYKNVVIRIYSYIVYRL